MTGVPNWLPPAAALLAAIALGLIVVAFAGIGVPEAAASFARGAFGSPYAIGEVLVAATPYLLCATAVAVAFRAGLFSIGAEGQWLAGMLGATALGVGGAGIPLVLLGAAGCGAAWAAIAAALRFARGVPEVLSTLLLNFVMLHLVALAVQTFLREPGGALPQSAALPADATLGTWLAGTRLHAGFALALLVILGCEILVFRTAIGLRWRAAGCSPEAARTAGFPVTRDLVAAFLLSGAVAGLSGGIEITGVTGRLYENPSAGVGYTAIAVALLGRNRPSGIACSAVLFGVLEVGCLAATRELGAPRGLAQMVAGAAILAFLAADSPRLRERFSRATVARREETA